MILVSQSKKINNNKSGFYNGLLWFLRTTQNKRTHQFNIK